MKRTQKKKKAEARSDCPISYALEIFGDRWTLLVLRDIVLQGRRRYSEMLASEEGIATNILTDRLRRLLDCGLIEKTRDPADQRQYRYAPTQAAIELIPTLVELVVWSARNDPDTAVPKTFLKSFEADRSALIAQLVGRAESVRR